MVSYSKSYRQTLLLLQTSQKPESRTFYDFPSVEKCIEHILETFEKKTKEDNPGNLNLTYSLSDLYEYLDDVSDVMCLVFNDEIRAFVPHNVE